MTLSELTTFEAACKVEGLDHEKVMSSFTLFPELDREPLIAIAKIFIVVRAANRIENNGEPWVPNWDDGEWKYSPYFDMGGSSGFRFHGYGSWSSCSCVGSRLCFKSRKVNDHVAKHFTDLYEQFMVIK